MVANFKIFVIVAMIVVKAITYVSSQMCALRKYPIVSNLDTKGND